MSKEPPIQPTGSINRVSAGLYDLDLNADRDRITLYRKTRVAHRWTREEALYIYKCLGDLIPKREIKSQEAGR